MVRIIAGTLLKVGLGLSPPEVVTSMLATKNRSLAGPPLSAMHLTLEHVEYHVDHPFDPRMEGAAGADVCSSKRLRP
jgi:tRNA U38,U39,U40 pseudouridine synthase TruA